MKRTLIISSLAVCCLALAVSLALAPKVHAAAGGSSKTAQSIMVDFAPTSSGFEVGDTTWDYTHPASSCAAGHYTTEESGPVVTCDGPGCGDPPPPTPPAPGDTPGHLNSFLNSQAVKCAFFCGGDLPSDANPQTVNVNLPGGTHWHFTWTYTLTPTGSVDPQTCWECSQSTGSVDVNFCGFVAGESFVLKSGGTERWTKKYSFTLRDDLGASRVTNVMAQLQLSTDGGTTWADVGLPQAVDTSFIFDCGKPTDTCDNASAPTDYLYYGNAGCVGNATAQTYLHATCGTYAAAYTNDIMSNLPDDFPNNNNNLCAYSQTAPFQFTFTGITQAGDYRVNLTGTVKGNSAVSSQTFSVSGGSVTVNGCSSPDCTIPSSCPE